LPFLLLRSLPRCLVRFGVRSAAPCLPARRRPPTRRGATWPCGESPSSRPVSVAHPSLCPARFEIHHVGLG